MTIYEEALHEKICSALKNTVYDLDPTSDGFKELLEDKEYIPDVVGLTQTVEYLTGFRMNEHTVVCYGQNNCFKNTINTISLDEIHNAYAKGNMSIFFKNFDISKIKTELTLQQVLQLAENINDCYGILVRPKNGKLINIFHPVVAHTLISSGYGDFFKNQKFLTVIYRKKQDILKLSDKKEKEKYLEQLEHNYNLALQFMETRLNTYLFLSNNSMQNRDEQAKIVLDQRRYILKGLFQRLNQFMLSTHNGLYLATQYYNDHLNLIKNRLQSYNINFEELVNPLNIKIMAENPPQERTKTIGMLIPHQIIVKEFALPYYGMTYISDKEFNGSVDIKQLTKMISHNINNAEGQDKKHNPSVVCTGSLTRTTNYGIHSLNVDNINSAFNKDSMLFGCMETAEFMFKKGVELWKNYCHPQQ